MCERAFGESGIAGLRAETSPRTMARLIRVENSYMECRTVALIALYVFVGFVTYILLAIPPGTGWDGKLSWGDVGTWAGAVASFSAAAAALWIAGDTNRKAERRDRKMAVIIATALCDELRGNRAQLEDALEYRQTNVHLVDRAEGMRRSLRSIHITAFRLFKDEANTLGTTTGRAVVTAYASLARCRDVEGSMEWPDRTKANDIPVFTRYLQERGEAAEWILDEVRAAIVLLWPLTHNQLNLPPPLTINDERTYAKALNRERSKAGGPVEHQNLPRNGATLPDA
jgi:hypothetical protein